MKPRTFAALLTGALVGSITVVAWAMATVIGEGVEPADLDDDSEDDRMYDW